EVGIVWNPASNEIAINGKLCQTIIKKIIKNAEKLLLNQAKPSKLSKPSFVKKKLAIPYRSLNIHRQTIPPATAGKTQGTKIATPKILLPINFVCNNRATHKPTIIVPATHAKPKTTVFRVTFQKKGSVKVSR